jgi:uncharacterized membrane protein
MSYNYPPPSEEWRNSPYRPNGFAVSALVLGILSVVLLWVPVVGMLLAVLAIIFGAIGHSKYRRYPNIEGRGMSITGVVLGIVSIVIYVIIIVAVILNS